MIAGEVMEKDLQGNHGNYYKIGKDVQDDLMLLISKIPKCRLLCKEQSSQKFLALDIKKIDVYNAYR